MDIDTKNFQTPKWVGEIMVGLVDDYPLTILEPTPGKGNLVDLLKDKFPNAAILSPEGNFWEMPVTPVDCIVANPPFTPMKLGYDMLDRLFEFSGNIVCLMPWFTMTNSEKRTKRLLANGLCKIIHLPRRAFPGSRVNTCLLKFRKGFAGQIIFEAVEFPK